MKKYRLKPWVKKAIKEILIIVALFILMIIVIKISLVRLDKLSNECDKALHRTCTYYEVEKYRK